MTLDALNVDTLANIISQSDDASGIWTLSAVSNAWRTAVLSARSVLVIENNGTDPQVITRSGTKYTTSNSRGNDFTK